MKYMAYYIFTLLVSVQLVVSENCVCKCGFNEHYGEGTVCDTNCATLGQSCPIQTKMPVKRCYCNEGFARDNWGICVPINECP